MGIFDWKGHNIRLNQVTPAMWHSTAIATRLVPRILELENKVVDTFSGSVHELMRVSLARSFRGTSAHRRSGMYEGPEEGGQGPDVTQWEGDKEEGGARGSGEDGPEAEQEDAQVDGENQLGSGAN